MTAANVPRTYTCQHCPETFNNPVKLGGHVHAQHPEHRRQLPKWLRSPKRTAHTRTSSLKRDTDTWPARQ